VSSKVRIPTQLQNLTGGRREVEAEGSTIADLLSDLDERHPSIRARVLDEDQRVRRFINIYVNDEDIRMLDGLSTAVPEGAYVAIIPAVAGG
jgi:MoaD family protein